MNVLIARLPATATAICVVGLSFQAFAAAVEPIRVQGIPTAQEVASRCDFPKVMDKPKRGISSPIELLIESPETGVHPPEPLHGVFQVELTVDGAVFSFRDISEDPRSGNPTNSQFIDVQGTEAVVAVSEDSANIYCNVNSIADSDLQPPSGELIAVRVLWSLGPSEFETQAELDAVCEVLNSDFFIGHQVMVDPPISFNGCHELVPRFCNAQDQRGEDFVVGCKFEGDDLVTDSVVLGSCGGTSGGSRIRC